MKLIKKLIAVWLAFCLISAGLAAYAEGEEEIPSAITFDSVIYSQRPDGCVFENPISTELVCGMLEDTLSEDGTPKLTDKGWYLYDTETPMIDSAKKSSKNRDFSKDKAFAFDYSKFYYWFHPTSEDPLGEILSTALSIISGDSDETQKLYALVLSEYAMELASNPAAGGYYDSVNDDSLQKGGRIYPATETAYAVNNILQGFYAASQSGGKLSELANDQLKASFKKLKAEYDKAKDKTQFLNDRLQGLTEIGVYDVRLNIGIAYPLELYSNGEEVEFGDGSKGYAYTFDDSAFYPVDERGFCGGSELYEPLFTMWFESHFIYHGGESFSVSGNDDIWVFINDKLVLDMGGVHSVIRGDIELDKLAKELGIKQGDNCKISFFYANRQSMSSALSITTTILPLSSDEGYVGNSQSGNAAKQGGFLKKVSRILLIVLLAAAAVVLFLVFTGRIGKRKKTDYSSRERARRRKAAFDNNDETVERLDDIKSLDELYGELDDSDISNDLEDIDDIANIGKEPDTEAEAEKPKKGKTENDAEEDEFFDVSGSIYDDSDISFLLRDIPTIDTDDE